MVELLLKSANPYDPREKHTDAFPVVPLPIQAYALLFYQCFTNLTHSQSAWKSNLMSWAASSGSQLAAHKAIQTSYFAVDFLRKYIQINPYAQGTVTLARILFNAVFEVVGLPTLNIDFADEIWAYYTLKAVDGDMEPLLDKVLEELLVALRQPPI
jgi:hypothetical protein